MHDDLELGTRDKVVTKMTRDGAVEDNLSKGTSTRVSARAEDADFEFGSGDSGSSEEAAVSKTKAQQRRYYRSRDSDSSGSDSAGESDTASDSVDTAEVSADSSSETGSEAKSGRSSLREQSVRSESRSSEQTTDSRHEQKKRQTVNEQKKTQTDTGEKPQSTKLSFDDEAGAEAKGSNLGGRFSSVTGKAAHTAKNVVSDSIDAEDDDNAGTDAVHKTEVAAVNVSRLMQNSSAKRGNVSARRASTVEQTAEVKASKLVFDTETGGTTEVAREGTKKASQKAAQKKGLGRKYAEVFRKGKAAEAGAAGVSTAAKSGEAAVSTGTKIKNFFSGAVKKNKGAIVALLAGGLFFVSLMSAFGTAGSLITGGGNAIIESSYLTSDDEIYAAENEYAGMEAALQRQVNTIESSYPGYDEYRYQVDEIAHNPYQLTSYLTVKYGNYTFADVQAELSELFQSQYSISVSSTTETITETREVRVGESLGTVVTSGYCNCRICCGSWSGGPTASGVYPTANHTIAVDAYNPTVPMGTKVVMNGVEYTVEDTGNFDRYGVDFDVYYDSHAAASAHGHQSWEAYLADSNGSQTVTVTQTRTVRVLNVTVTNAGFDLVARNRLPSEAMNYYNLLNASFGNRDYLWDTATLPGYNPGGMSYEIPPEALNDVRFRNMITEAERYLGYPYVWGGSSPSTSFDCSGFVSWVINNCGNGWSVGRLGADGLRGICTYVSPDQAKPGDLIFFQGTYDTTGASHVGIYVGNGMMIHCGNPIQYTSIESNYWQQHFLCFGRLS